MVCLVFPSFLLTDRLYALCTPHVLMTEQLYASCLPHGSLRLLILPFSDWFLSTLSDTYSGLSQNRLLYNPLDSVSYSFLMTQPLSLE